MLPKLILNTIISVLIVFLFEIFLYAKSDLSNIEIKKVSSYLDKKDTNSAYLDLESALAIAINNNFELKAIKAQKTIYSLAIDESFRDLFPTLALSYLQSEETKKRDTDSREHRFAVDSEILIYDGGRKKLAYDVSKLKAILARNDYRIALNRLIMEVHNAFFEVLLLRDSIKVNEKTFENGNTQLEFITKEFSLGEATKFDVLEIQAKVKGIEFNLLKAISDYETAINKFKLILKLNWKYPILLSGDITKNFIIKPIDEKYNFDYLVDIAVKNRKEVESADIEHDINKRTYLINKLYYFPQFSIGANYNLSDDRHFPREKGWGVTLKVTTALWGNTAKINSAYGEQDNYNSRGITNSGSLNILDNLSYKRNELESKINLSTAGDKQNYIRQQIAIEVSTYFMVLKNSWNMIETSAKQLELYDSQLQIERLKANMGESRRYDLIKKEIERGEAAMAYLDSLVRYLVSASTLEIALGMDIGFFKVSKRIYEEMRNND